RAARSSRRRRPKPSRRKSPCPRSRRHRRRRPAVQRRGASASVRSAWSQSGRSSSIFVVASRSSADAHEPLPQSSARLRSAAHRPGVPAPPSRPIVLISRLSEWYMPCSLSSTGGHAMSRRFTVALVVAALVLTIGAGGATSQGGKVAMLLPGSINDQSWTAAGYSGLARLKERGVEIAYSENVQAADHVEAMKDYARRGFSPIIGHSGRFLSAAQRVGPEFEKTIFLVGSGSGGQNNVISLDVANEQYAYVVGVLAA